MNRVNPMENPFELSKASNYSDSEIYDYWVDIMEDAGGLTEVLKPKERTPLLLLGGKGSGKTHLMRYCSAPVQVLRVGNLKAAVEKEGYLGVYVHAEGLNTHKFEGKGQSNEAWAAIFSMYFELWLVTALLEVLASFLGSDESAFDEADFVSGVAGLFDRNVSSEFSTIQSLIAYLGTLRKDVDYRVNNSSLDRSIAGLEIVFSNGSLAFGIPDLIGKAIPSLADKTIVYLVDEVENFSAEQQKFLNTLIRYRKGKATIRVGARLYGMKTYDTLGAGEPIRVDAEFKRVVLDELLRDKKEEYEKLLVRLVCKRIQPTPLSSDKLNDMFARLDRGDFKEATLKLALSGDKAGRPRPYLKKLATYLERAFGSDKTFVGSVIETLRVPSNPFLEKANVFMLYKKWTVEKRGIEAAARDIAEQCRKYQSDRHVQPGDEAQATGEYSRILNHFSSDLLAQIHRDFQKRVPYAGFDTLVKLSQGIPRNFLTILEKIYRRSLFAGERPFINGVISIESQAYGVRDSSQWFWDDAQPDGAGKEVREAIEALALLFRSIRFSDRPAECDVCTFSVDLESLTAAARDVVMLAENWSYLVRIRDDARNKNDRGVSAKYQLGPMLAPKWDVSENRRGNIELSQELANALFDRQLRAELPDKVRARISGMTGPDFIMNRSRGQEELFS